MVNDRLTSYLRTYRRRTGLSQSEVAFLICAIRNPSTPTREKRGRGTTVSRHECGDQLPLLEAAIGYEIVFGVPLREIYAGFYQEIHALIRVRAADLVDVLSESEPGLRREQKVAALKRIMSSLTDSAR